MVCGMGWTINSISSNGRSSGLCEPVILIPVIAAIGESGCMSRKRTQWTRLDHGMDMDGQFF